jgi:chloride channel protein, CIC family
MEYRLTDDPSAISLSDTKTPMKFGRIKLALSPQLSFYPACAFIGIGGAAAAVLLKRSVSSLEAILRGAVESRDLNYLILALPPIGLLLSVLFVRRIARADLSHGVTKVLSAISRMGGRVPSNMIWAPLAGCTITVGFGGSLGMEAPIMHAGSAIGSAVGRWLGLDYRRRVLLVGCGTAAAVAAIFKAPVAGALFAIEILMIDFTAQVAIPLLVSSVTGALVSKIVSGTDVEFYYAIFQPFDYRNVPFYLLLGALCALGAAYLRYSMGFAAKTLGRIKRPYLKALVGGLALAPLILLYPPLFGEGYSGMKSMLSGKAFELLGNSPFFGMDAGGWVFVAYMTLLVLAKGAATSITGAAGGVGGIFAPSLFMGAVTGFVLARVLHLIGLPYANELNFALVGMAGVLAALLKAPLTSVFLIAEITGGYQLLVPLICTAGVAYVLGRRFSRYSIYAEALAERNELVTHQKDRATLTLMDPGELVESDFQALPPDAPVTELMRSALATRRSSLPVLDEEGFLLGIVRFDEVRRILLASSSGSEDETEGLCVSDVAVAAQYLIGPGMGMDRVLASFEQSGSDELPFLGADGRFIGFITKSRALGAYRAKLLELSEELE